MALKKGGNIMLNILGRFKIKTRLFLLTGFFIFVFILFALFYYNTFNTVKVQGPYYNQIVQGKDLIADILPPPNISLNHILSSFKW